MGLRFDYPADFEALWSAHPVGVKKAAFDAWRKLKLDASENQELIDHLVKRHREDAKWLEGKYVPHLSSFLNQRRWEDAYQKIWRRESTAPPAEIWVRMGYACEADYLAGRRMQH